jgi:hypothetical protein
LDEPIVEEPEDEDDEIVELRRKPSYDDDEVEELVSLQRRPSEDIEESFRVPFRRKSTEVRKSSYTVEHHEEEFQIGLKRERPAPEGALYEEESLQLKLKSTRKPSQTLHQG